MDRRDFLKFCGTGMLSALLYRSVFAGLDKKPNVLFIAIDDLNDWVGCLGGHPDTVTPNIDRLAERGMLFRNAHCPAPLCGPSRAAVMTGVHPVKSGVYDNTQSWRKALGDVVTLPQYFKNNGYYTAGGGKIFHGGEYDLPAWDDYYTSWGNNPKPESLPANGIKGAGNFDWGPIDADDSDMGDFRTVDFICEKLKGDYDRPFFLAAGIFRPHLPWFVPQKYFDRFRPEKITLPEVKEDDLDDVPRIGRKIAAPAGDHKKVVDTKNWRKAVAAYLACVNFADACVGKLVDCLEKSRYADNTVIVLWSDHGWHLGEKLHWRKFTLWEEATHNPMIFVYPGVIKAGTVCDRVTGLMDIYPSLVELCGLPAKVDIGGRSLVNLFENPEAEFDGCVVTSCGYKNVSVRTEEFRYIRYSDGAEELYDHRVDRHEWNNVASDVKYAKIKSQLLEKLPDRHMPPAKGLR